MIHSRSFPLASHRPATAATAAVRPPPSAAVPRIVVDRTIIAGARTDTRAAARRTAIAEVQAAADITSTLSRLEGNFELQDLNSILRHFGENKRWSEVSQTFEWMQKHEKLNFATYSGFFKYMGLSRNPMKALQIYERISDGSVKTNVSVCNSILGCLVRNGRFDSSIKLFDKMKECGLSPDLVTYSTLLAGCTKVQDGYNKAMKLVHELEDKGLQMDGVIYGSLLAVCASNSLSEEAESLFQQMKAEGFPPNVYHYSSLLNAYSGTSEFMKADKLIREMRSSGLEPNKVILTSLLKVYSRSGLFEKSKELLTELKKLNYADDEIPYCLLMDNLAKAGLVEDAKTIFEEMKKDQVRSEGFAYSVMISAYCRSRRLKEAKQLAEDFEANYAKYDLVMLNTLLRAYCNAADMENVMQMLRKMDDLLVSPDWNTFQILIKYFTREKLYQLAYRTVQDMHSKGHQLDEALCSSLILQLGQAGLSSEAYSVYNLLRYSKRTICTTLHEKMLHILVASGLLKDAYVLMKDNKEVISASTLEKFSFCFMRSGNINLINDVLKSLHRSGFQIDPEIFHVAIERYIANAQKKDLLLQMLQWMSGQGYIVNSSSRNLLLKNSHLFGQKQIIADMLSRQHVLSRKQRSHELKRDR